MLTREHVQTFREAAWTDAPEVDAYVVSVGAVATPDLLKLLEILLLPPRSEDANRHRARCFTFQKLAEGVADRALFVPYVKAFKVANADTRETLGGLIPRVVNPGELGELAACVKSPDPVLRQLACELLRQIGGKAVFQQLAALVDEGGAHRTEAIDALVQVAGTHALPHLQSILSSGKQPERVQVLKALGDPRYLGKASGVAARAIATALHDKDEIVVQQAVASYAAICTEDDFFAHLVTFLDSPNHNVVKAAVDGLRRFRSPRVIAALQRKLQSGPNKVRLAVLVVLEAIGTEEMLPALVDALGHKHVAVRGAAGEVFVRLSRAGKLDAAPTIVWLLRSKDVNVRRMAAEIAKSVRDPNGELWPKLVAFIKDEDWWVRERVMDALVSIAGVQLAQHFVSYLADPSDVVRRFAVDVIARLKDRSALPALLKTSAGDTDWWVRERAVEAIASFKDERTVPHLISLMKRFPELHLVLLQSITDMRAKSAAPHLAPPLASEDPEVRLAALRCLQVIGDPTFAAAVTPLAADPEGRVRKQATLLLRQWDAAGGVAAAGNGDDQSRLDRLLVTCAEAEADDLILESGNRPFVKRLGKVVPMGATALTEEQVNAMLLPNLSVAQIEELEQRRDVDFSYEVKADGLRFRANVFRHIGGLSAVFRIIKGTIPDIETLGLPPMVKTLGDLPNGLVLVGGPTGSGKSTTLAAVIDYINRQYGLHIISLEDPIEVVHGRKKGLVNQREIGTHTKSFARALRSTLREDPDVILVGEMRDMETIHFAVTAADTGHLVFGTVHTVAADTAVDRLINVFPSSEQQQARASLANSLRAVICQYLLKRVDGTGRVLAAEILVNNDAVSSLIRKGKSFQIPSVIATSKEVGMQSMDADLMRLFREGKVSAEEVYLKARNKKEFEGLFGGGKPPDAKNVAAAGSG